MRRRSLLLFGCSLALLACPPGGKVDGGGDVEADSGTPADGGLDAGLTSVPIEAWCSSRALASCTRDLRCRAVSAPNLSACLARQAASCDQPGYSSAVAGGRLAYAPAEAAACLDAYASGGCETTPARCASVFRGQVPPDGGCVLPEECDGRGFCLLSDAACPHRCRGFEALGATCDGVLRRCAPSGACALGPGGQRVCVIAKAQGDSCLEDECGAGQECIANRCVRRDATEGETCGYAAGFPYCTSESFCRQASGAPAGVCTRRGGLGATCIGSFDCLPSLRCSTVVTTGTCLPKGAQGERCAASADCEDDLFCSVASGLCKRVPGAGGDCSTLESFYRCAPGTRCALDPTGQHLDRCEALRTVGADCSYSAQCLSNDCQLTRESDGGSVGRCVPPCSERADGGF